MKCLIIAALTTIAMVASQTSAAPTVEWHENVDCTGASYGTRPVSGCLPIDTPGVAYKSANVLNVSTGNYAKIKYDPNYANATCVNSINESYVPCGQCILHPMSGTGYYRYNCDTSGSGSVRAEGNCNEGCGTCVTSLDLTVGGGCNSGVELLAVSEVMSGYWDIHVATECSDSPIVTASHFGFDCGSCYGYGTWSCPSSGASSVTAAALGLMTAVLAML